MNGKRIFEFIGTIAAIAILGTLAFYVGKDVIGKLADSRKKAAKAQVESVVEERVNIGGVMVTIYEHEGHEYIIADAGYGAGIIHSESCPCKTEKVVRK